jgi:hypothetical protein
MVDFTDMGMEPKWTGICAAWAIIFPFRSKMAQEESRLSLMLEEKAVLVRITPISSQMEENRFLNTSNKMGFSFTFNSFAFGICSSPVGSPFISRPANRSEL